MALQESQFRGTRRLGEFDRLTGNLYFESRRFNSIHTLADYLELRYLRCRRIRIQSDGTKNTSTSKAEDRGTRCESTQGVAPLARDRLRSKSQRTIPIR